MKRSRTRRVLKWAGLAGCVLVVGLWGVSLFGPFGLDGRGSTYVGLGHGEIYVQWMGGDASPIGVVIDLWNGEPDQFDWNSSTAWHRRCGFVLHFYRCWEIPNAAGTGGPLHCTWFPLWYLLLPLAIPTAYLWYRDRRKPPGRCEKCGYDLTGNVSGRCPECGRALFDLHR
jgi:hypothetical protein